MEAILYDRNFRSVGYKKRTTPATPPTDWGQTFYDIADGHLKIIKQDGSVVDLEAAVSYPPLNLNECYWKGDFQSGNEPGWDHNGAGLENYNVEEGGIIGEKGWSFYPIYSPQVSVVTPTPTAFRVIDYGYNWGHPGVMGVFASNDGDPDHSATIFTPGDLWGYFHGDVTSMFFGPQGHWKLRFIVASANRGGFEHSDCACGIVDGSGFFGFPANLVNTGEFNDSIALVSLSSEDNWQIRITDGFTDLFIDTGVPVIVPDPSSYVPGAFVTFTMEWTGTWDDPFEITFTVKPEGGAPVTIVSDPAYFNFAGLGLFVQARSSVETLGLMLADFVDVHGIGLIRG